MQHPPTLKGRTILLRQPASCKQQLRRRAVLGTNNHNGLARRPQRSNVTFLQFIETKNYLSYYSTGFKVDRQTTLPHAAKKTGTSHLPEKKMSTSNCFKISCPQRRTTNTTRGHMHRLPLCAYRIEARRKGKNEANRCRCHHFGGRGFAHSTRKGVE